MLRWDSVAGGMRRKLGDTYSLQNRTSRVRQVYRVKEQNQGRVYGAIISSERTGDIVYLGSSWESGMSRNDKTNTVSGLLVDWIVVHCLILKQILNSRELSYIRGLLPVTNPMMLGTMYSNYGHLTFVITYSFTLPFFRLSLGVTIKSQLSFM